MKQDKWWPGIYEVVAHFKQEDKWYEETVKKFMVGKKAHRLCNKLNKKYDNKKTWFEVYYSILPGNHKRNKKS